jgi:hypothetical protein
MIKTSSARDERTRIFYVAIISKVYLGTSRSFCEGINYIFIKRYILNTPPTISIMFLDSAIPQDVYNATHFP